MPDFLSASLLTPSSLFLLLNIMIATIIITSRYTTNRKTDGEEHRPPPLVRAPSLIDRVKSINFSLHKFSPFDSETTPDHLANGYTAGAEHPPPLERAPSLLERLKSVDFSSLYRPDPEHEPVFTGESEAVNHPINGYTAGVDDPPPLERAPSLLDRLKSVNFSSLYRPDPDHEPEFAGESEAVNHSFNGYTAGVDHPPPLERAPSLLDRLKSVNFPSLYRPDPEPKPGPELAGELGRSQSEKAVAPAGKGAEEMMRKSASEKGVLVDEVEERERGRGEGRRAETVRLGKTGSFGDDGVDAKADDFINRFKQQMKLERLDSLLRYRNMLRGK